MVEHITSAGLHAVLDYHGPDIDQSGHFICGDCGWHEPLHEDGTINSWAETWWAFVEHLTQPIDNKEVN